MGRKLDNWSFGLSLIGNLSNFLISISLPFYPTLYLTLTTSQVNIVLSLFLNIITWGGFILGIVALTKKPERKWKPIVAIILPIVVFILKVIFIYLFIRLPFWG